MLDEARPFRWRPRAAGRRELALSARRCSRVAWETSPEPGVPVELAVEDGGGDPEGAIARLATRATALLTPDAVPVSPAGTEPRTAEVSGATVTARPRPIAERPGKKPAQ
jgi:hypothetical protein